MKIKILIPVYNDWQSAFKLLENINSEVSNLGHEFSVIIVNDASTESRPELSKNLDNLNSIKIINMKENRGHARCNASGLKHIYENEELSFVKGNEWIAGNLSYHLPKRPKWIYDSNDIFLCNKNLDCIKYK